MGHDTTQPSLLSRVRDPANQAAWREFDAKYRELIIRYCRARSIQAADAEDVRQIAMTNLAKSLRAFEYRPERGRFRGYLGQVVRSAISRHFSRPERRSVALDSGVLATVAGGSDGEVDELWEQEWMRHHYRLAMQHVRTTFEARSIDIFDRLLTGDPVKTVAVDYDLTEQAVHKIKQRIRNRLKELIAGQIEEEDEDNGEVTAE